MKYLILDTKSYKLFYLVGGERFAGAVYGFHPNLHKEPASTLVLNLDIEDHINYYIYYNLFTSQHLGPSRSIIEFLWIQPPYTYIHTPPKIIKNRLNFAPSKIC